MSDWAAVCVAALSTVQVLVLAYIARDALKNTTSTTDSSRHQSSSTAAPKAS